MQQTSQCNPPPDFIERLKKMAYRIEDAGAKISNAETNSWFLNCTTHAVEKFFEKNSTRYRKTQVSKENKREYIYDIYIPLENHSIRSILEKYPEQKKNYLSALEKNPELEKRYDMITTSKYMTIFISTKNDNVVETYAIIGIDAI